MTCDPATSQGAKYAELEITDDETLDLRLGGNPQEPVFAAQLIGALARSLQNAHQRGILHRDLKPSSIALDREGNPKIIDFGVARQVHVDEAQTAVAKLNRDVRYLSPEQAAGRVTELTTGTDIHALGAILYEILTGRPPLVGTRPEQTLKLIAQQTPVSPAKLQPSVPIDLAAICLKCLEKQPRQRYTSAAALANDLDRFLAGEPVEARSGGLFRRLRRWLARIFHELMTSLQPPAQLTGPPENGADAAPSAQERTQASKTLEMYEGFVEEIEQGSAYVRLDTARGERLCGPYPADELASKGIGERDRFVLKAIELNGAIRFEAELIPRKRISPERQRQIRAEIELGLEGFTPDDER